MDTKAKLDLIKRNTQEIVTDEELEKVLKKKKPVVYWGTAPTGQIHTGYLTPVQKLLDFVEAGFEVKILIADIHAYLDDMKTPWDLLNVRSEYYKKCLQSLGLTKNVKYILDTEFKFDKDYVENIYRLSAFVTQTRAVRAASEVTRMKNPKVSELIYPIAQTLDCWKLGVDVAYSGVDQRHIYMMSREMLPKLGLNAPVIVMTPMVSGLLKGVKSSASVPESNIMVYDEPDVIKKKISGAWCPLETEENPVLEHFKFILFPKLGKITIKRDEKFGGNLEFDKYEDLEVSYKKGEIHPSDLKSNLAEYLIEILKSSRAFKEKNKELIKKAYPND